MNDPIRILHTEDDAEFASLVRSFLERDDGITVEIATSAEEALCRLETEQFDCVVSDYDMPGQDGIVFLERVRKLHPHLPFILFTGKGSEEIASEAIASGVTDYLQKGGIETYEILANRIENAVSQARLRRFEAVTNHDPLTLLDRFSDPLYALDSEWRFTYVNSAAGEIFDAEPNDLVGESIWEVFPEATETPFYDRYREALESGEPQTIEEPFDPWDRWFREHIYPEQDGLTIVSYDVTDDRRRQEALERNRELLRQVETLRKVGGWEYNAQNDSLRWTDGTFRIHGVSPDDQEAPSFEGSIQYYHPDDRQNVKQSVRQCLEGGETFQFEARLITATDEMRWILAHGEPIRSEDGKIIGARGAIQDVTDRKRDRRELERSRDFFAKAERLGNLGAWEFDMEGSVTWTAGTRRIHGVDEDYQPTIEDGLAFIHEDDRDRVEQAVTQALEEKEPYDIRARLVPLDARERWVRATGEPLENGDTVRGFIQDITEQAQRERELLSAKAQLEAAVAAGQVGTWEWDITENKIVIDPGFAETFGVAPADARRGLPLDRFTAVIDPRDRDSVVKRIEAAVESCGSYEAEYRVRIDGEVRWVIARGNVDCNEQGEPVRFPGALIDITERKQSERELEQYREVIEKVADPIYILDRRGHFVMVNQALLDLVGYERNELIGESIEHVMPQDDVDRGSQLIADLLADEAASWQSFEMRITPRTGPPRITETKFSTIIDEDEFEGTVGVIRDITERKAYERELERQNRRLDEFASIVSHDLRNPLNVAAGRLELARADCESPHLEDIDTAIDRMESLIDALLTFARVGEAATDLDAVDLQNIAHSCWTTVDTGSGTLRSNVTVTIQADPDRLRQLFENLYRNAIEHGGADVTVRVGRLESRDGFFIEDDGQGIPQPVAEQVLESGYSTRPNGTGLGLAIVSQIADAHGWELSITSGNAGGARFEISGIEIVHED